MKKIINKYPRCNDDWKYINYLEYKIKELEDELRSEKKRSSKYNQEYLYLKYQTIPQLENKLAYYKQSLL